ncbi:MAG: hypothetical protein ACFHWZ_13830 [Phycisphaerales bacterium]
MYRSSVQILLIAAIMFATAVAPMVRASVSCCAGEGHSDQRVALAADAPPDLAECGSCCAATSVLTPQSDQSDDLNISDQHSDDPCSEDCGCTLCRVMASVTTALVDGPSIMSFAHSSEIAFVDPDQVFARDTAFGLLRPPQS